MKSLARRLSCAGLALFSLVWMVSCASEKSEGFTSTGAVLRGMVYDENRTPVSDVDVSWVGKDATVKSARSDVHGRYLIPEVAFGQVTLHFAKQDYEPVDWTFSFESPMQVVYVRMVDLSGLLDDVADSIQKRDWAAASSLLDRIHKLQPDNRVAAYLKAVLLARQGNPELAAALLEKLSAEKGTSFAIELTLADLYQYKLAQPDKALLHLKAALAIQDDIDVENRISALEKM